jgi:hypothetical protein
MDKELQEAIESSLDPELHEELLAHARASAAAGNVRRAVLEAAIALEVLGKNWMLADGPKSGPAFEYLEDRGKLSVRAIELFDSVSRHVVGTSFKDADPGAFEHIDFLFRTRNKIAHRGAAVFRDDQGNIHSVTGKDLESWWESIEALVDWVGKN